MFDDQMKDIIKYRKSLRRIMATEDGQVVAKGLTQMYVDPSALAPGSQLMTGYRLGQKELIQSFLKDSNEEIKEFDQEFNIDIGE